VNQVHAHASVPAQLDGRGNVDLCYNCYLRIGCTFRDEKWIQHFDGKHQRKSPLGTTRRKWDNNIELDLNKIG
jgi:hypothetical protein